MRYGAPFSIGGREVFTSASIGIAFGRRQYNNPDEIMRDADTAMYHAKSRGKARHEMFDADMHARERDRLGLENDLRHAVNNNDFEVHYQPIVSAGLRDVRRLRVPDPMDTQRQAGLAGHVHPDRRGARAHRAAGHVGAPAGVPDVRRLAAPVSRGRPRLHHRQRVQPAAACSRISCGSSSRRFKRPD